MTEKKNANATAIVSIKIGRKKRYHRVMICIGENTWFSGKILKRMREAKKYQRRVIEKIDHYLDVLGDLSLIGSSKKTGKVKGSCRE